MFIKFPESSFYVDSVLVSARLHKEIMGNPALDTTTGKKKKRLKKGIGYFNSGKK